jgi:hypothetical protein
MEILESIVEIAGVMAMLGLVSFFILLRRPRRGRRR